MVHCGGSAPFRAPLAAILVASACLNGDVTGLIDYLGGDTADAGVGPARADAIWWLRCAPCLADDGLPDLEIM